MEVLARMQGEQLRIVDASKLLHVGYRQAKRLWRRYRDEGAAGLKHRHAGRLSNHIMSRNFATRYCSWCGRSIAVRKASALVRLWRPSAWIPKTDCR